MNARTCLLNSDCNRPVRLQIPAILSVSKRDGLPGYLALETHVFRER